VEDEKRIADFLCRGLQGAGYAVDAAPNGGTALEFVHATDYDLVILDIMLPDIDGLQVLEKIRNRKAGPPVLILSARGALDDRVRGLEQGADDYLVKPFAFEELIARIRAMLRRSGDFLGSLLRAGNVSLDTVARPVFVDDKPQGFSAREVALLEILIRRPGLVIPKRLVEDHLFGLSGEVGSNAVEVYVHRLRKQLAEADADVEIHTIRGVGYLIAQAA